MKIESGWMKGLNVPVADVPRNHRTSSVVPNHSGMPISAWKNSKPQSLQVESISGNFFFGRNGATQINTIAIDGGSLLWHLPKMGIRKNNISNINLSGVKSSNPTIQDNRSSFHSAIHPILVVAQCFAVLPVSGIHSTDFSQLKFSWKSPIIIYQMISFLGAGILMVCSIIRVCYTGITAQKTTNVVFFGAACSTMLLFLRLATRWPDFVKTWAKMEKEMSSPILESKKIYLKKKLWIIFSVVMLLALVEHLLSIVSGYASARECASLRGENNIVATYFQSQFPQIFDLTEYAAWKGFLVQCVNILSTFTWNFMDVFLMLISSALADRFRQMNERLNSIKGKAMPNLWWAETREDYNRLANLTRRVDQCVSDIVLLSFGTNLYFICIQLLNSLKPRRDLPQTLYTIFSFGFLLLRTAAVSLCAAEINDESLRPTPILYSVSAASYSTEVQRFLTQTTTDRIGLTGLNFFAVTRGLILTVAGTIVTYELVLVQFNAMQSVDASRLNITDACEVK